MQLNINLTRTVIIELILVLLVASAWQVLRLQYGYSVSIDVFIDAVLGVNVVYLLVYPIGEKEFFVLAFILLILSAFSSLLAFDQPLYLFSSLTVIYLLLGCINLVVRGLKHADVK